MRVIKFRGKRPDGSWNYGRSIRFKQNGEIYIQGAPVAPQTVGQFIGLFDKNGKEIYEGDIICKTTKSGYPDNFVGEIVFRNGLFGIKNDSRYGLPVRILVTESEWIDGNASGVSTYEYEIIGNIYDNAELLKEHGKDF